MRNRVIAFDLDDVLCYRTSEIGTTEKYRTCRPYLDMIELANQCYDRGDTVIVYTARGMTSFKGNVSEIYSNLYDLTHQQLKNWGLNFHQLIMGKAHYDLLIDDKAVNSEKIKNLGDIDKCL